MKYFKNKDKNKITSTTRLAETKSRQVVRLKLKEIEVMIDIKVYFNSTVVRLKL